MEPMLHKILLKIESDDLDTTDYFGWTEEEKQELTNTINAYFLPIFRMGGDYADRLIFNLMIVINEAEEKEDYVVADIMNRCLREIEKNLE
jgi:hypothetical protein